MTIYEYCVTARQDDWRRIGERNRLFAEARRARRARRLRPSAAARGGHQHRLLLPLHGTAS